MYDFISLKIYACTVKESTLLQSAKMLFKMKIVRQNNVKTMFLN
jgi:hypothetical protein